MSGNGLYLKVRLISIFHSISFKVILNCNVPTKKCLSHNFSRLPLSNHNCLITTFIGVPGFLGKTYVCKYVLKETEHCTYR